MRNVPTWLLTLSVLFLAAGCGEPQRSPILKDVEKFKDRDQVFREVEYYQGRRGQKVEHGRVVQYFPDGKIQFRCQMRDGKTSGTYEQFYPTGEPEIEAEYVAGRLQGKLTKFHRNGKPAVTGQNVKDLQDGPWRFYDENGKVLREETWKEGVQLQR